MAPRERAGDAQQGAGELLEATAIVGAHIAARMPLGLTVAVCVALAGSGCCFGGQFANSCDPATFTSSCTPTGYDICTGYGALPIPSTIRHVDCGAGNTCIDVEGTLACAAIGARPCDERTFVERCEARTPFVCQQVADSLGPYELALPPCSAASECAILAGHPICLDEHEPCPVPERSLDEDGRACSGGMVNCARLGSGEWVVVDWDRVGPCALVDWPPEPEAVDAP